MSPNKLKFPFIFTSFEKLTRSRQKSCAYLLASISVNKTKSAATGLQHPKALKNEHLTAVNISFFNKNLFLVHRWNSHFVNIPIFQRKYEEQNDLELVPRNEIE